MTVTQEVWRRNGKTQTWKTRPNEFRVPVKCRIYTKHDDTKTMYCGVMPKD